MLDKEPIMIELSQTVNKYTDEDEMSLHSAHLVNKICFFLPRELRLFSHLLSVLFNQLYLSGMCMRIVSLKESENRFQIILVDENYTS